MAEKYWMSNTEYLLVTSKVPIVCSDLVILRYMELGENPIHGKPAPSGRNYQDLETLLLRRKTGYESGKWCIIGGRQWKGERAAEAIKRHAADVGVKVEVIAPFSIDFPAWINDNPEQDRTKHSISRVYPVKIISGEPREEGEEFKGIKWFSVTELPEMAYDHRAEILKAVEQLKKFGGKI